MIRPLLRKNLYDQNITVKEKNAKQMTCRLVREEGMFSGTSTGANVLASIQLAKESGKGSKIVTVAVDTGLKYLWTEPYLKTSNAANSELASPRNNQTANDN